MSILSNMDDLFKDSPLSSLSFTLSELSLIMDALYSFLDKVASDSENPNMPAIYYDNGESQETVCQRVIDKFCSYCFK